MKNLFDPTVSQEVRQRIVGLQPENERQWGTMTLAQTLAHCTRGIEMAMGTLKTQRAGYPARFIGLLIKPLILGNDKPMRRNSPSSPALFTPNEPRCEFQSERAGLITAVDGFTTRGAVCCGQQPHPFFGPLKPQEWAILTYKHIDHHLRQFNA